MKVNPIKTPYNNGAYPFEQWDAYIDLISAQYIKQLIDSLHSFALPNSKQKHHLQSGLLLE